MSSLLCALAVFAAAMFTAVSGKQVVTGMYGDTITVPCNNGNNKPSDLIFTKWKYLNEDNTSGDLLVKQAQKEEAKIIATNGYKDRISITPNSSLLIRDAALLDEKIFICIVVSLVNLNEYPVEVAVYKRPSAPEIKNKASQLENGKLTLLGECVSADANPPSEIVWLKNNKPLLTDNRTIIINSSIKKDPSTSLSTSISRLQYMAGKEDTTSKFTCVARHVTGPDQHTAPENFSIHYPTEKMSLQFLSLVPIKEGDNVTLRCQADGNPPPTRFNFDLKGEKHTESGRDMMLAAVNRNHSGEYKCSLASNDKMVATATLNVTYLDLSLSPTGDVNKNVGESLEVKMKKSSSSEPTVSWTKDNEKLDKLPDFSTLTYSHAGFYVCQVSVLGIKRSASFRLVVQGSPVIKSLKKHRSANGKNKVLVCEAEGSPEPDVHWSVNGTHDEKTYKDGKAIYKLTVVPSMNLTVTCQVSNTLGYDSRVINVSSHKSEDSDDKAKVIVAVVVGLLVVAALVGIIYWLYMRRRQGSWKTGEKEAGTSEESKKLEENNHRT
ncbi:CD166 antigen homolog A isoform X2 [Electrophorus electricus]|uniref:CD166 antigen homolog A isoform X2 n=1 Tax=Electrophorus electricus TaxID=8005 RepID=UPI0015D02BF8|nr:CD166 antigen homolog A isoform X2 [Electrophorus electricus]